MANRRMHIHLCCLLFPDGRPHAESLVSASSGSRETLEGPPEKGSWRALQALRLGVRGAARTYLRKGTEGS
jgi:hypothetical protein